MQYFYQLQLDLIKTIQLLRCPLLDNFFFFLNFFDTFYFPLIIIPIIWMMYNWKWGLKLTYLLILSYLANELLKNIFGQPRPFNIDPSVGLLYLSSHGLPSGAVQSTTIYSGLLLTHLKNKKVAWIISANLIFWIGLSRMYLGVHFFTDLIGGFVVGLIFVFLFNYLSPKIELFLSKKSLTFLFSINLIFCSSVAFLHLFFIKVIAISCFILVVGLIISKRFNCLLYPTRSIKEGIFKTVLFLLGFSILILTIVKILPSVSKENLFLVVAAIMSLWLGFGINLLWNKCFYKCNSSDNPDKKI